mgnify:CR=1 FL=1
MPPAIPPRQPLADVFTGAVIQIAGQQALISAGLTPQNPIVSGTLIIRYGVRFLGKPHLSIVPGLVAIDYGEMLVGEEAWEFIHHRSNLYPRAEVFGYRNDGRDEMLTIKLLDLVQPVEVLVYTSETATTPSAKPTALIAASTDSIPPRLLQYLPHFTTLADWQDRL